MSKTNRLLVIKDCERACMTKFLGNVWLRSAAQTVAALVLGPVLYLFTAIATNYYHASPLGLAFGLYILSLEAALKFQIWQQLLLWGLVFYTMRSSNRADGCAGLIAPLMLQVAGFWVICWNPPDLRFPFDPEAKKMFLNGSFVVVWTFFSSLLVLFLSAVIKRLISRRLRSENSEALRGEQNGN